MAPTSIPARSTESARHAAAGRPPGAEEVALQEAARRFIARHPQLPRPGQGATLERWRQLAGIAADDVGLAKILEAHYDAQAILAELGGPPCADGELLAVWAAEAPQARIDFIPQGTRGRIDGTKAWCSGAAMVDRALVTTHGPAGPQLVRVSMRQPGIRRDDRHWQAIGMDRVTSGEVHFDEAQAEPVGPVSAYLDRAGFWHGGAGVAACWFGAATAIAETLRRHRAIAGSGHARTHLGALDVALGSAAALLRETAALIDRRPGEPHQQAVLRVRALVERVATEAIDRVGRALGPAPLCQDRRHAQRCADLAVFVRQSHAERDWETLGGMAATAQAEPWRL